MLKKIPFLLFAVLPIACSSDDEEEQLGIEITQVNAGNEVKTFFESELTSFTDVYPKNFFVGTEGSACYLINNVEEFQSIYQGQEQLPEIDFSKNTLIIG